MRQFFPVLEQSIYLNTAYVGPLSRPLLEYRKTLEQDYFEKADLFKIEAYDQLQNNTQTVADFLGASISQTYLVSNFTTGIRYFLQQLPPTSKVLLLKEDYPSLVDAFSENVFDIDYVAIDAHVEANVQERLGQKNYDVLALSMVQYTSGLLFDMEALRAIKKAHPELLIIVDATQWMGTVAFSFRNAPIDLVVGSGYKWLLAGFNSGFACVSSLFFEKTKTDYNYFWDKIYAGHFNFLGTASIAFAVNQLQQWGFSELLKQKDQLALYLKDQLQKRDVLLPLIKERTHHSSIFNIRGNQNDFDALQAHGVRCSLRGNGIRVSVHYYNTKEEVDRFLELL